MSWFTYDTVAGGADHQRWYTLSGPVMSGQPNAALTIYQNTGGNFNALPITTAQPVGTATLSFTRAPAVKLSYSFTDGRMGNIPLTRLTQNVTCSTTTPYPTNADFALSGNWYDGAATSGQGFTVEVNPIPARSLRPGTPMRRWFRCRGGRTTVVHRARDVHAGHAFDPGADLRNHRWDVRHADPSWPANGAQWAAERWRSRAARRRRSATTSLGTAAAWACPGPSP